MTTQYGQFCPIALAAEVIAERWTPLILREIVLSGARRFGEFERGVGAISSSLLAERLRTLEDAGLVERRRNPAGRGWEYHPTAAASELEPLLTSLGVWAQRWIDVRRDQCAPAYLMTKVTEYLRTDEFPLDAVVVRFTFFDEPAVYWLILDRDRPELCFHDPGRPVDLHVTADTEALANVVLGRLSFASAVRAGRLAVDGPTRLARRLPNWIGLSPLAPYTTRQVTLG
jgi:DNA-binding HxlR family transcriptional regulator